MIFRPLERKAPPQGTRLVSELASIYRVTIVGTQPGLTRDEVVRRLVPLFKRTEAEVAALLGQQSAVVKRGVGLGLANKYRAALEAQGCVCALEVEGFQSSIGEAPTPQRMRELAEQGDREAQLNLGNACCDGNGILQDHRQAVAWWTKAAEQGSALAQYNLGCSLRSGQGIEKDFRMAFEWTLKAAQLDLAAAQYAVGFSYKQGLGPAKDMAEASRWFAAAAKQGNTDAQSLLSKIAETTRRVT
jgi:TPR repeat protein